MSTAHPRVQIGLAFAALSLLGGALIAVRFLLVGQPLPLSLMAWPAAGFLMGVSLAFFPAVSQVFRIEDELEALPEMVKDDLEIFSTFRLQQTHVYLLLSLAAALVFGWLIFRYQKWYATWSGVSVLAVALGVALAVAYHGMRCRLFQERPRRLPRWAFAIPAIGFAACAYLGLTYAEPQEWGGMSPMERTALVQSQNYAAATRELRWLGELGFDGGGGGSLDFDCDGEVCAVMILFVILVAIVVVSVIASATIPHFWVVATATLLAIMLLVAVRELLYVPGGEPAYEP